MVGDEALRLVVEADPFRDALEDPIRSTPPRRRPDAVVDPLEAKRGGAFRGTGCAPPPVHVQPAPEWKQSSLEVERNVDGDESLLQLRSFPIAGA